MKLDTGSLIESARRLGSAIPGLVLKNNILVPTPLIAHGFSAYVDVKLAPPAVSLSAAVSASSSSSAASSSSATAAPKTVLEFALQKLRSPPTRNAIDARFVHALCSTQGAPGTGKSHFIDKVAHCLHHDDPECLVLPISFNGATAFGDFDTASIKLGLAARMLLSALFEFTAGARPQPATWHAWTELFPHQAGLDVTTVVRELVAATGAKRVVFMLDELIKVQPGYELAMRAVLDAVDADGENRRVLVTSLDGVLPQFVTTSGRPIQTLPLLPLPDEDVLARLLTDARWLQPPYYWLMRLAMGHPRSLFGLSCAQEPLFKRAVDNLQFALNLCQPEVFLYSGEWGAVSLGVLAPVLLSEAVPSGAMVPDHPATYAHFLKRGIYINTYVDEGAAFVPKVSMLRLFLELMTRLGTSKAQLPMGSFLFAMLDHIANCQTPDARSMEERGLELWHAYCTGRH